MSKLSDLDEAFCRIHMLEFMLQNVLVKQLLTVSDAEAEAYKLALVYKMQNPTGSGTARHFAMVQKIGELAERFVAKIAEAETVERTGMRDRRPPRTQ